MFFTSTFNGFVEVIRFSWGESGLFVKGKLYSLLVKGKLYSFWKEPLLNCLLEFMYFDVGEITPSLGAIEETWAVSVVGVIFISDKGCYVDLRTACICARLAEF